VCTVGIDVIFAWGALTLRAAENALKAIRLVALLPITADDVVQFSDQRQASVASIACPGSLD